MSNITLPNSAIPDWAKVIPEEKWKSSLVSNIISNKQCQSPDSDPEKWSAGILNFNYELTLTWRQTIPSLVFCSNCDANESFEGVSDITLLLFFQPTCRQLARDKCHFCFCFFIRIQMFAKKIYKKSLVKTSIFWNGQISSPASFAGTFNFVLLKIFGKLFKHPKSSLTGSQWEYKVWCWDHKTLILISSWTKTNKVQKIANHQSDLLIEDQPLTLVSDDSNCL